MVSKVALDIQDTTNIKSFRIKDISAYNPKLAVENAILEITSPGFNNPVGFTVKPYFDMAFNASLLSISTAKARKSLIDLPDGVYDIKYSIKPNNQIFIEYTYFRNTRLVQRYMKAVCELFDKRFTITKKEFESKRQDLIWIKELIDTSKYKVEDCEEESKGLELYGEANHLLNHFSLVCNDCEAHDKGFRP